MPRIDLRGRRPALGALAVLLACTCLAACGSASGGSNGSNGSNGSSNGSNGSSKSSAHAKANSSLDALSETAQNKVYEEALTKYAACLRQHGIAVPKPTAAKGQQATLDTNGINKTSARFKRAQSSCSATLDEALRVDAGEAYEDKHG